MATSLTSTRLVTRADGPVHAPEHFRSAVYAAAAVVLLGAGGRAAQQITGFSSVAWGATAQQVIARWGQPQRDTVERDLLNRRTLAYRITLLDESVEAVFELHPAKGLMAGEYRVSLCFGGGDESCAARFERAIRDKYPGISPRRVNEKLAAAVASRDSALRVATSQSESTWGASFRFGLDSAQAENEWALVWTDPANGATIRFQPGTLGLGLVVRYEAREYAAWARELRALQQQRRF